MAFCSKCGSVVSEGAAFCSVCGAPSFSASAPSTPSPTPISAGTTNSGLSSNVAGALAYLFITGIIFLLIDQFKKDKFVRFHSFQAIAFGIAAFLLQLIWSIIMSIGYASIGFLLSLFGVVYGLIGLAIFIYWLFLMFKAYNNETYKIPVIGEWASKQADK